VGEQRIWYGLATASQCVEGTAEIDGVPEHDGGSDERQATGAVLLQFGGTISQTTEAVEAHRPRQRVAAFALVEFRRRLPPERGLFQPVQGIEGAFDAADLAQRECQPVLFWIGAEALEDERCADGAGPDGGGQAQHIIPMRGDEAFVGATGDEGRQRRPVRGRSEAIEPTLGEVGDTWREPESQQMGQGKDVITDAAAVGVMDGDTEVRLVIEQPVDDVGGLARGWDGDGMVRGVTRRNMRVEQRRHLAPVVGIDGAHGFAASGGRKTLAVGAGYVGGPEQGGEWLTLLGIDQHGECRPIGFLAQVPAGGPGKLAAAGDRAGLGHAAEAEVGRLGQHAGEHDAGVIGGRGLLTDDSGRLPGRPACAGVAKCPQNPLTASDDSVPGSRGLLPKMSLWSTHAR
jgi:hypothetical protein